MSVVSYRCPVSVLLLDQRLLGERREQRAPALSKEAAIACAQLDAETQRERYRALELEYDADMLSLDFVLEGVRARHGSGPDNGA